MEKKIYKFKYFDIVIDTMHSISILPLFAIGKDGIAITFLCFIFIIVW